METVYPKYYEIKNAGSAETNGLYEYKGVFENKPYYIKLPFTKGPVLWYFNSPTFLLSSFNGWYVSKELGTSSLSAHDDYYSNYINSSLPPLNGWVTREPGFSMVAGCGRNPPPSVSSVTLLDEEIKALYENELNSNIEDQLSNTIVPPNFNRFFEVIGAGDPDVNGVYEFVDAINHRPYFLKYDREKNSNGPALWYFYTPVYSLSLYNGWYISKVVSTSSVSAGSDYYTAYEHNYLPPESGWVTRIPGLSLTAGCGTEPAPTVLIVKNNDLIIGLNVQTPNNQLLRFWLSIDSTVLQLKFKIQETTDISYYEQRLVFKNQWLLDELILQQCSLKNGDTIILEILPDIVPPCAENEVAIAIVGAGPVGLWVAVQIKLTIPSWSITCYERRKEYLRNHALRIDNYAFDGIFECEELNLLRKEFQPRTRTSIVENKLKELALKCGIRFQYGNVSSIKDILEKQTVDIIIGCDGAKSVIRNEICGKDEFFESTTLGSLLQIKFDAMGDIGRTSGKFDLFLKNLPANQQFFNILSANFDTEKNVTPITIFTLINDEIFTELKDFCNSANPFTSIEELEQNNNPRTFKLAVDISKILENEFYNGIIEESLKISVLPASYYISHTVVSNVNQIPVFIAGDAAMGLPLEKGLNYGWKIASNLARNLCYSTTIKGAQKGYETFFKKISVDALRHVNNDYNSYVNTVKAAGVIRSFVKIFV